jgi:hypothetical protein
VPAFDLICGDFEARTRILRGDDPCELAAAVASVDDGDRAIVDEALRAANARSV